MGARTVVFSADEAEAGPAYSGVIRGATTAVALALIGLLAVAGSAHAAAWRPDPTFDGDGEVTTDFGGIDSVEALALQPDGKTVAAGTTCCSSNFALLARYAPDGSLDAGFGGGDGKVAVDFGGAADGFATVDGLAVQPEGTILAAGTADLYRFGLARYEEDGRADEGFGGGDGAVATDFRGNSDNPATETVVFGGMTTQPDGKIIVTGTSTYFDDYSRTEKPNGLILARYNTDGGLDSSFGGGDGMVVTDPDRGESIFSAREVAVQPDGRIVVAGSSVAKGSTDGYPDLALARFEADGSPDLGFGSGDGEATADFGVRSSAARDLVVLPDGKIAAAGNTENRNDFAVARFAGDGSADTSFGGDGMVTTDFEGASCTTGANALVAQPDGKLVAGGNVCHPNHLVRYEPDGSLDASFGDGGKLTDNSGDGKALVVSDDGKITTAGESRERDGNFSGNFVLTRYYAGPDNVLPVARKDLKTVRKNGRKEFNVLKNDSDPDGDKVVLVRSTQPRHGDARCAARGTCVYRPDPGYRGRDSFTYRIRDDHGGADSATVKIRVGRGL